MHKCMHALISHTLQRRSNMRIKMAAPALNCFVISSHIRDRSNGNRAQVLTGFFVVRTAVLIFFSSDGTGSSSRGPLRDLPTSFKMGGRAFFFLLSVPSGRQNEETNILNVISEEGGDQFLALGAGQNYFKRQNCSLTARESVSMGALPLLGLRTRASGRGVTGRSPISGFFFAYVRILQGGG